jgi:cytochrome P450
MVYRTLTHFSIKVIGRLPHLQQILRYLPSDADGQRFGKVGDDILAHRLSLDTSPQDIFSHLLIPDRKTGIRMTEKDLKQHILLVMTVGAHSVSTTLTRILAVLASKPEIQSQLRLELEDAFNGEVVASYETMKGLKYLDGVVKEGLRMFAPLLGGTPAVTPKGGVALNTGDFIPEHTQVWVGQHVMMSDEKYFHRAAEFLPERWVAQDATKNGKATSFVKDRRAWIPFGYGAHACGGRELALAELKIVIAMIVREFDICFQQQGDESFDYEEWAASWKDLFLTMIEKIDLRFIPRAGINR